MKERELYEHIGYNIWKIRREKGLTQQQLADKMGLSRTSITNIERGRQRFRIDQIYRFAVIFQVSLARLLPFTGVTIGEKELYED